MQDKDGFRPRLGCLDKGIDIELILQQWQVSRLEELYGASAQQVREWMESHYPSLPIQQGLSCHHSLIQVRLGPAAGVAGLPGFDFAPGCFSSVFSGELNRIDCSQEPKAVPAAGPRLSPVAAVEGPGSFAS